MKNFSLSRILLSVCVVLFAAPQSVWAQINVSTWSVLKKAMDDGIDIILTADVTDPSPHSGTYLHVPKGKTVTLDLNGFTIDRGLASSEAITNGFVIKNEGTLTILDGSADKTGKITGGNEMNFGGGIFNMSSLKILGGTISGNKTKLAGGGICNANLLEMSGGTISGNEAQDGGGIVQIEGKFKISGGTISGNKADGNGGGIFYMGGNISLEGNPTITGNLVGENANNIYLSNALITISGTLTNTTPIGITMKEPGVFTSGLSGKGDASKFCSDSNGYITRTNNDGEGMLVVAPTEIGTWDALKTAMAAGGNLILTANVTDPSPNSDSYLHVPSDKTVKLDLNGFTIDRGLASSEAIENGFVIKNEGTLTIQDGSTNKTGKITGGSTNDNGGGIYNTGTFKMSVGTISGNKAYSYGGGIYNTGTLEMSGGTISSNNAKVGGGIVNAGTLEMSGGAISGNEASNYGGGIYDFGGINKISGGSITGNKASQNGGGIYYMNGSLSLQGNPTITGNLVGEASQNILFKGNAQSVNISGMLTNTTPIGITMDNPGIFTSGLSVKGDASKFCSDSNDFVIRTTNDGEAMLVVAPTGIGTWNALKTAMAAGGDIILTADVTDPSPNSDSYLHVPSGKTVTLDLNGFTLDRGLASSVAIENGFVIKNEGTLTIQDGSTGKTGKITGGSSAILGGGIYNTGTLDISGGTISGNHAGYGGGIANSGYLAILEISGGTISDNVVQFHGGGIRNSGTVKMSGGTISGNGADFAGGIMNNGGILKISGGTITGNLAVSYCGGIYHDNYKNPEFIDEFQSVFSLEGNPLITDNLVGETPENIFLKENSPITISGTLTNTTPIGIVMEKAGIFTSGLSGKGDASNFCSDSNVYITRTTNDGEAMLVVAPTGIGTWNDLKTAMAAGGDIILTADVTDPSPNSDSYLHVPSGKTVKLDLNGFTLDRGLASSEGITNGFVIINEGTLTIQDGSIDKTGKITGGSSAILGGGIYNTGTLDISGGTISGNHAGGYGGGIANNGYLAILEISGGTISDNVAKFHGGGIRNSGTVKMSGGTISGNGANYAGGIYNVGTLKMSGGTISGNKASKNGGGIYYMNGSLSLQGNPTIADNLVGENANNIYLETSQVITISGTLSNTTPIGITMNKPGVFTSGLSGKGDASNFCSDNSDYQPVLTIDGEAILIKQGQTLVSTWNEISTAMEAGGDVILGSNIVAGSTDHYLRVPTGKTVTLDLNGFTIDRGLASSEAITNGFVIMNTGTLTIQDGSADKTGKITGGNSNIHGGGISNYGTLTLQGGTISGNKVSHDGGGISNSGTLEIAGGTISGNESSNLGGGIYNSGNLIIHDGTITENKAAFHGGGIIHVNGNVSLQGNPTITGNLVGENANNIYLETSKVITISGMLSNTTPIGITMKEPGVFTSGLSGKGYVSNFSSDNSDYQTMLTIEKEAKFVKQGVTFADSWENLKTAMAAGGDIILTANVTDPSPNNNSYLYVSESKVVTLDLNGFTINRGLASSEAIKKGFVIQNDGILTIQDVSAGKTGNITGGNHMNHGGGIWNGGTFKMLSGTISGNVADLGGGIWNEGTLEISGGTISCNKAGVGGGIFNSGTLEMLGGTISGNEAGLSGGIDNEGTLEMSGGTISGNEASESGGGISNYLTLKISGGTISDNKTGAQGGGIYYINGSLSLQGNPTITGNLYRENANNIYVEESKVITITGTLTNTTPFGIKMEGAGVFTSGLSGKGDASNFSSDNTNGAIELNDEGEAMFVRDFYVCLSPDLKTLTFYYDAFKKSRTGTIYALNSDGDPKWIEAEIVKANVTTALFDSSIADFYPSSMRQWFKGLEKLTIIIDMDKLNTGAVTTYYELFAGCTSLQKLDISSILIGPGARFDSVFEGTENISKLTIGSGFNLDVSNFYDTNPTYIHAPELNLIVQGPEAPTLDIQYFSEVINGKLETSNGLTLKDLVGTPGGNFDENYVYTSWAGGRWQVAERLDLSEAVVTLVDGPYDYIDPYTPIRPEVARVTIGDMVLNPDWYQTVYEDDISIGTAKARVIPATAIFYYKEEAETTYEITQKVPLEGEHCYRTYYNSSDVDLEIPTGYDVQTITDVDWTTGVITMEAMPYIPKGKPVILHTDVASGDDLHLKKYVDPDENITSTQPESAIPTPYSGFVGVATPKTYAEMMSGNQAVYVLTAEEVFVKVYDDNTKLPANRCYLAYKGGTADTAPARLSFEEVGTGIDLTPDSSPTGEGSVYDLQGRKVMVNGQWSTVNGQLPPGVYIVNGKKIYIK